MLHSATIEGKHRTNNLSEGYNRAFALSLSASPSDWHIIDRFRTEEAQARQSMFQAVKGNVDTENSTSRKRKREHREDQLRNCWAIYYPATPPSKLLDGNQGHPLFLPAAWDRPATTEPGSKTVYTRHCLFSKHL
jgi:hypothetical protein